MNALQSFRALFYGAEGKSPDTAVLFTSEVSRRFLTGFPSSDGFVAITKDKAVFWTDSRYIEAAKQCVSTMPVEEQQDINNQLRSLFTDNGIRKIEVEVSRLSVRRYRLLQQALSPLEVSDESSADDSLAALRCVKTAEEVARIEKAQSIAQAAFDDILTFIRPGVSEKEIALHLDYAMLSRGAQAVSFETIAIAGENTSKPHGVPSDRKVQNGDFVTMDFGAVYDGYHSDMTRTVAVGSVSEEQKKIYAIVLQAKQEALSVLRVGLPASQGDKAARDVIEKAGFGAYFRHSTGHGVGLEIHELPNLSPRSEYVLQKGNIVTVEPGIYLPGAFGVRIEDMALIEETGCKNLTSAEQKLIVL